jgi:hypothetical protein
VKHSLNVFPVNAVRWAYIYGFQYLSFRIFFKPYDLHLAYGFIAAKYLWADFHATTTLSAAAQVYTRHFGHSLSAILSVVPLSSAFAMERPQPIQETAEKSVVGCPSSVV